MGARQGRGEAQVRRGRRERPARPADASDASSHSPGPRDCPGITAVVSKPPGRGRLFPQLWETDTRVRQAESRRGCLEEGASPPSPGRRGAAHEQKEFQILLGSEGPSATPGNRGAPSGTPRGSAPRRWKGSEAESPSWGHLGAAAGSVSGGAPAGPELSRGLWRPAPRPPASEGRAPGRPGTGGSGRQPRVSSEAPGSPASPGSRSRFLHASRPRSFPFRPLSPGRRRRVLGFPGTSTHSPTKAIAACQPVCQPQCRAPSHLPWRPPSA